MQSYSFEPSVSFYSLSPSARWKIGILIEQLMMRTVSPWLDCHFAGCLFLGAAEDRLRSSRRSRAPRPSPALKQAPPTPIAEKKEELGEESWDPQWDVMVEQALSPEMLSPRIARGVRPFCPRFASLSEADKRAFWAYTFQALAGAEAGLKPTSDVRHTEPEVAVQTRLRNVPFDKKGCCS